MTTAEAPRFTPADLTELANSGVLLAANERFFWPLGLALTWDRDDNGAASGLHVRQWDFPDGHRETIADSADGIAVARHAAFAKWLDRRIALLPSDEQAAAESIKETVA